ncbi:hypothetical protein CC2G_003210 [Coprinopsis cinerea AmutBmut pab1-1]|nr:hypothetical protein CC2G_003210 [Coprinopsis cinerea AmutBmut pab1-1]
MVSTLRRDLFLTGYRGRCLGGCDQRTFRTFLGFIPPLERSIRYVSIGRGTGYTPKHGLCAVYAVRWLFDAEATGQISTFRAWSGSLPYEGARNERNPSSRLMCTGNPWGQQP